MATLQELISQRKALERQIEEVSLKGRTDALEQIKALMAENNLTLADLGGRNSGNKTTPPKKTGAVPGSKVAAKYRDAVSGESWSGRGLQPRWLKAALASGKKIEDFAV